MKDNSKTKKSRRKFVKSASIAAGGLMVVPRHVIGGDGYIAPSDKLNIAGIGLGGKGRSDLASFVEGGNVNVVALCDVDDRFSAPAREDNPKAIYYKDFRRMFEQEHDQIDAVSIATPDHTHAVATLAAMQLGKHVYTQKPLTHDIYEARQLAKAAKKYKVITQMGNQHSSADGVRIAKELYETGMIGEVHTIKAWTDRPVWPQGYALPKSKFDIPSGLDWDLWLGTAQYEDFKPDYVPWSWRAWYAFGTGALGDIACHTLDPALRILPIKYPSKIECSIPKFWDSEKVVTSLDGFPSSASIHFTYPRTDGKGQIELLWYDGGLLPPKPVELLPDEELPGGGILFEGDKGKLLMDGAGHNPRFLPTRLMKNVKMPEEKYPRVPEGHYLQWVNACIAGFGNAHTSSPFEYAGPLTESILAGNLAIRSWFLTHKDSKGKNIYPGRKSLEWDSDNMRVLNFDEANQFVKRKYRDGWSLEF